MTTPNPTPKHNVVPLLFHTMDSDGVPVRTWVALLSTDDGDMQISNLTTGQAMTINLADLPTVRQILDHAEAAYDKAHAPLAATDEVVGEPVEVEIDDDNPGDIAYVDGREVEYDERGMPVLYSATEPEDEVVPAPPPTVVPAPSPVRRAQ